MSFASHCNNIKNRAKPNDVFITPLELAKKHIEMIDYEEDDLWLDPCKNSGSYYNQFPTDKKDFCEILDDKDFFQYEGKPQIICDNPPYSMLDKWHDKVISLTPRVYSSLIGVYSLTPARIQKFQEAGYGVKKMRLLRVKEWFMMTCIVVFEKEAQSVVEADLTLYSTAPPPQLCKGFNKKGKPCQNKTKCGEFCHLHRPKP